MKLSIIIPCKNEEGNVKKLYTSLNDFLEKIDYEIIFIDDGSTDNTILKLKELYMKDKNHIKILSFSRNFRKDAAILAGLENASGMYTCIIDGDLQQHPKYLLDMINFLDNNSDYDEVAMVMKDRSKEGKVLSICKKLFYKSMNKLSDIHFQESASDFRMFRKNVKDAIISLKEKNRFSKGIFSWVGFKVKYMTYDVEARNSGKSSFGFISSLKYALAGILDFSYKPLKLSLVFGIFILLMFAIYFMFVINNVNLDNLIIILLLLFSGMQFIFIGIIGLYISNIQNEVKSRPVYIVKEKIGFKED